MTEVAHLVPALDKVGIVQLTKAHDLSTFVSAEPVLDDWLRDWALKAQQASSAQTHVLAVHNRVVAYYSLSAGSVSAETVEPRISQGCGRYPVPVVLLARLAVDTSLAGQGIGTRMLLNAGVKAVQTADAIGVRAFLVDALNVRAGAFYGRLGFRTAQPSEMPGPDQARMLYLLIKDLRATLRSVHLIQ